MHENNTTWGIKNDLREASKAGRPEIEQPVGLSIMLLSRRGVARSKYLQYPPKGRDAFPDHFPIYFEASNERWMVCCEKGKGIIEEAGKQVQSSFIKSQNIIEIVSGDDEYMLYAEEVNRESFLFHKYMVLDPADIRIGRASDNDMVCVGEMVSRYHAVLRYKARKCSFVQENGKGCQGDAGGV